MRKLCIALITLAFTSGIIQLPLWAHDSESHGESAGHGQSEHSGHGAESAGQAQEHSGSHSEASVHPQSEHTGSHSESSGHTSGEHAGAHESGAHTQSEHSGSHSESSGHTQGEHSGSHSESAERSQSEHSGSHSESVSGHTQSEHGHGEAGEEHTSSTGPGKEHGGKEESAHEKSGGNSAGKKKSHYLDTPPCLTWQDIEKDPKAAILCVHGLGLHNNAYAQFGQKMAEHGYAVYAVDVRGFGSYQNSMGREKVDFDSCLEDVHKTLKVIHRVHRNLPVFILGESMGGAIALRITSMYPELIAGMVSSVPSGDRFQQGKTTLRVALKLLTAPNKEFDVGTQVVNQATKDPALKKRWLEDRLGRNNLSPKELLQFQNFMNENHDSVKKITNTPVLMVQGLKDKLVKPTGTISLFNAIPCQDKAMIKVEDAEHLIFEEGQFDDHVIDQVDTWLSAHLTKKTTDANQLTNR